MNIGKALPIDGQPSIVNEVIADLLELERRLLLFAYLNDQIGKTDKNKAES